jgi:RimJ/RimL family protein N-acetyltransferase
MLTHFRKLIGPRCYLSPCTQEDAEAWTRWENDLTVALPLGSEAYTTISAERMKEQIESILSGQQHIFDIVTLDGDELIGRCMLVAVDHVNRHAMLGILIGESEYQSQGYGAEAIRLLLDYGFNLLNLNSVMLGVMSFNRRAIRCYEKVGFQRIGRRRQSRIIGERRYDTILMDILADEFESPYVVATLEDASAPLPGE